MMKEYSEQEKERLYREAVGYLSSSLTNDELFEENLAILKALGEYQDASTLFEKYSRQYAAKREETEALSKKRKVSRILQAVFTALGFAVIVALILILVYALKLDVVR